MSRYLDFWFERDTGKTRVYAVMSQRHGDRLGTISWFGRWRQYAFAPTAGTRFNAECMRDIATFCEELMQQRRRGLEG